MPYQSNSTNQQSKENQGQPRAEALPVTEFDARREEQLEQEATNAGLRHPNRNLDKPSIYKPTYS